MPYNSAMSLELIINCRAQSDLIATYSYARVLGSSFRVLTGKLMAITVTMSKSIFLLLVLSFCSEVHLSYSGPTGTRCEPVEGAPNCTCKTSQGVIDLTKIASFNGSAR